MFYRERQVVENPVRLCLILPESAKFLAKSGRIEWPLGFPMLRGPATIYVCLNSSLQQQEAAKSMIDATVTMSVALSDTVIVNEEPKVLETPDMAIVLAKVSNQPRKGLSNNDFRPYLKHGH